MEIQHFTWDSKTGDTRLYWDYLRLRKRIFVDERHWPMPCFKGAEFDFYDLPFASYVFLTHKDGSLAAGLRLIRADNVVDYNGQRLTYMINDAFHRRLPTIPRQVSNQPPPTDSRTWELSRIVSTGGLKATGLLVKGAADVIRQLGAKRMIFLGNPQFRKLGHYLGFDVEALGPVIGSAESDAEDARYQAMVGTDRLALRDAGAAGTGAVSADLAA
ncbi:MAG: hypothetical protein N838_30985 [Thiohalocapsa sp. PB-PSB1]|nr:MAG: hypothetical protein N838_30985 [Thiohalocapsa sp. PB-PSB1]MBL4542213.1 hypothetical protein [Paracoccaceae bacterium]